MWDETTLLSTRSLMLIKLGLGIQGKILKTSKLFRVRDDDIIFPSGKISSLWDIL